MILKQLCIDSATMHDIDCWCQINSSNLNFIDPESTMSTKNNYATSYFLLFSFSGTGNNK